MPKTVNVDYVTKTVEIKVNDGETESLVADMAIAAAKNSRINAENAANSVTQANAILAAIRNEYGYPFTASTVADMTDQDKIYVYTGSETGYTNGHWYYHNGTAWTDGGVYNAVAFDTDKTLAVTGAAADAKVTGYIKNDVDSIAHAHSHMLYDGDYTYTPLLEQGRYVANTHTRKDDDATYYLRTGYIPINPNYNLIVNVYPTSGVLQWRLTLFDNKFNFVRNKGVYGNNRTLTPTDLDGAAYCHIVINKANSTAILPSDVPDFKIIQYGYIGANESDFRKATKAGFNTVSGILTDGRPVWSNLEFEKGRWVSGTGKPLYIDTWIRNVEPLKVVGSSSLYIHLNASGFTFNIYQYDANYEYVRENSNVSLDTAISLRPETCFVNIGIYNGGNAIDVTDADTLVVTQDEPLSVPSYYLSHMETKVPQIISNMNNAGRHGESFVFITDIHWETNYKDSPALIRYLLRKTNLQNILCGGDIINEGKVLGDMYNIGINAVKHFQFSYADMFLPIARGNHDDNSNWSSSADVTTYSFDYDTVFNLFYNQIKNKVTFLTDDEFNFYFDSKDSKTRYVFIDTGRGGNTLASADALISMLNSIADDMNVVFVMHIVYKTSGGNTVLCGAFLRLASIVNGYKNKTAGTAYGITWDFTSAHGKPIVIFGGHKHQDLDMTYDDENNPSGVPVIVTDTDSYRNHANTAGTTDSQCFDVVTIDYTAKTIKCVRIGRGNDRTFTFE